MRAARCRGGFTLIEVLVVIAIIGILAGLLMAALGGIMRDRVRELDTWPRSQRRGVAHTVDGKMTFVAGNDGPGGGPPGTGRLVQIYDPQTKTWSRGMNYPRPEGRVHHGSALFDGRIYILGGISISGGPARDTVDVYDPGRDTWALDVSRVPRIIMLTAAVGVGQKIYVFGGMAHDDVPYDAAWAFDPRAPAGKQWQRLASLPEARTAAVAVSPDAAYAGITGASANSRIFVIGGVGPSSRYTDTVYEYHINSDTWRLAGRTGIGLHGYGAVTVNGGRYAYVISNSRRSGKTYEELFRIDLKNFGCTSIYRNPAEQTPVMAGCGTQILVGSLSDGDGRGWDVRLRAGYFVDKMW